MESQTIISRFKSCASRTPFGYMHYASPLFSCPNFVSTSVFLGVCAIPMIRETYISPILSSLATVNSSFRSQDLPFHTKKLCFLCPFGLLPLFHFTVFAIAWWWCCLVVFGQRVVEKGPKGVD